MQLTWAKDTVETNQSYLNNQRLNVYPKITWQTPRGSACFPTYVVLTWGTTPCCLDKSWNLTGEENLRLPELSEHFLWRAEQVGWHAVVCNGGPGGSWKMNAPSVRVHSLNMHLHPPAGWASTSISLLNKPVPQVSGQSIKFIGLFGLCSDFP